MRELLTEVERFQSWAAKYPADQRSGEWECDYRDWTLLCTAVLEFVDSNPFASWTAVELSAVLFAIARDNEAEYLSGAIRERGDELLLDLTETALRVGEPDAKWQLASELATVTQSTERRDQLLLTLARDEEEYVRRRSLKSLALLGSPEAENLACEAWSRVDAAQQWSRMMALWVLHHIGSHRIEPLLAEAEQDPRPYLAEYAANMRRGEVD